MGNLPFRSLVSLPPLVTLGSALRPALLAMSSDVGWVGSFLQALGREGSCMSEDGVSCFSGDLRCLIAVSPRSLCAWVAELVLLHTGTHCFPSPCAFHTHITPSGTIATVPSQGCPRWLPWCWGSCPVAQGPADAGSRLSRG